MSARILIKKCSLSRASRAAVTCVLMLGLFSASAVALSPEDLRPRSEVRVAPSESGHFVVSGLVNGQALAMVVDTGASQVVLSYEDALRAGIKLGVRDFTQVAETANGITRFAPVTLAAVSVGAVGRENVLALVAEPGRLSSSLLGMTFLSRLSRVGTRDGHLVLSN